MDEHWQALTGQHNPALVATDPAGRFLVHRDMLPAWQSLVDAAAAAGFGLSIASAYRSFERQNLIWQGKATGKRAVLDSDGGVLDTRQLTEDELLFAMLRWSAIPGCSRHHWGSDVDVYDSRAVPADYAVQLTAAESSGAGPFAALHDWLDRQLAQPGAFFFRPYARDRGGIAPERWHLSFAPVASQYDALLDESRLADWIATQDIALKAAIRRHWPDIFHRYIRVSSPA
ncbi:MAG TPA: M15 family metallopeptidase [Pseudomonadales bacterium]|nr:M15 family metallopeptidase [Pseudomonadales bacterium]